MTDTVKTRAQLVAALASTGAKTITAQTMRNWLISTILGLIPTAAVKTANYAAAQMDFVPCDASAAGFTVTLPAAPADKTLIGIKLVAVASSHAITVSRSGSDVFDKAGGDTTRSLSVLNQTLILQYDAGTAIWYAVTDAAPLAAITAAITAALASYLPLSGGEVTGYTYFDAGIQTGNTSYFYGNLYLQYAPIYVIGSSIQAFYSSIDFTGGGAYGINGTGFVSFVDGSVQSTASNFLGIFTSGTQPSAVAGATYYQSDTQTYMGCIDGATWLATGGSGIGLNNSGFVSYLSAQTSGALTLSNNVTGMGFLQLGKYGIGGEIDLNDGSGSSTTPGKIKLDGGAIWSCAAIFTDSGTTAWAPGLAAVLAAGADAGGQAILDLQQLAFASGSYFGFNNVTPVQQQTATGNASMPNAGSGAPVLADSTFDGGLMGGNYTIGDIVLSLKNYGLLA